MHSWRDDLSVGGRLFRLTRVQCAPILHALHASERRAICNYGRLELLFLLLLLFLFLLLLLFLLLFIFLVPPILGVSALAIWRCSLSVGSVFDAKAFTSGSAPRALCFSNSETSFL